MHEKIGARQVSLPWVVPAIAVCIRSGSRSGGGTVKLVLSVSSHARERIEANTVNQVQQCHPEQKPNLMRNECIRRGNPWSLRDCPEGKSRVPQQFADFFSTVYHNMPTLFYWTVTFMAECLRPTGLYVVADARRGIVCGVSGYRAFGGKRRRFLKGTPMRCRYASRRSSSNAVQSLRTSAHEQERADRVHS
jgi:hypothetical protein